MLYCPFCHLHIDDLDAGVTECPTCAALLVRRFYMRGMLTDLLEANRADEMAPNVWMLFQSLEIVCVPADTAVVVTPFVNEVGPMADTLQRLPFSLN